MPPFATRDTSTEKRRIRYFFGVAGGTVLFGRLLVP